MPLYKGELSVDTPAAARALIAQQARKMLSEIAHDRMCVSDELERWLDETRELIGPPNTPLLHACGPQRPSRCRQSPFQRCLLCRTRGMGNQWVRAFAAVADSGIKNTLEGNCPSLCVYRQSLSSRHGWGGS